MNLAERRMRRRKHISKKGPQALPTKGKGKKVVQRSPHKQSEVTLVLPCIPPGVKFVSFLLEYIDKLCYSDHDVKGSMSTCALIMEPK
jgi:hypothetical protein